MEDGGWQMDDGGMTQINKGFSHNRDLVEDHLTPRPCGCPCRKEAVISSSLVGTGGVVCLPVGGSGGAEGVVCPTRAAFWSGMDA